MISAIFFLIHKKIQLLQIHIVGSDGTKCIQNQDYTVFPFSPSTLKLSTKQQKLENRYKKNTSKADTIGDMQAGQTKTFYIYSNLLYKMGQDFLDIQ